MMRSEKEYTYPMPKIAENTMGTTKTSASIYFSGLVVDQYSPIQCTCSVVKLLAAAVFSRLTSVEANTLF